MKKSVLLIWALLFLNSFSVNAEYRLYDTKEELLEAKWDVCEVATDGCNDYNIVDWKITWWTERMCFAPSEWWTCKKFKDWVATTKSLPTWGNMMCTMQYLPVCWVDGKTYWNSCTLGNAWVDEDYVWECRTNLDDSELSKFKIIKESLDEKYQTIVYNYLSKFKSKVESFSEKSKNKNYDVLIKVIDKNIASIDKKVDFKSTEEKDQLSIKRGKIKILMLELLKIEIESLKN